MRNCSVPLSWHTYVRHSVCRWLHLLLSLGHTLGPRPAPLFPGLIPALRRSPNSWASGPNPKIHYEFGSSPIPPYKFLHLGTLSKRNTASRYFFIASDKIFSELSKFLGELYSSRLLSKDFHFLLYANASLSVTIGGSITLFSFHLTISTPFLSSLQNIKVIINTKSPKNWLLVFLHFFTGIGAVSGMKPDYGVRILSSFLVLFVYFRCSEMETAGFPDRSEAFFHGQEDQGVGGFPLQAGGTPGQRNEASWYSHARPSSINIYPPLPKKNKCYMLSAERSSHPWEERNSFSVPWWRSLLVHTVNVTLNPVPTDSLEAFTVPVTLVFSCTHLEKNKSQPTPKKGGCCMEEDDLCIFLLEDLKLPSCLSYLGHCWKDTQVIREETERKSK